MTTRFEFISDRNYSYTPKIDPNFTRKERVEIHFEPAKLLLFSFNGVPAASPTLLCSFTHLEIKDSSGLTVLYIRTASIVDRLGLHQLGSPTNQSELEKLIVDKGTVMIENYYTHLLNRVSLLPLKPPGLMARQFYKMWRYHQMLQPHCPPDGGLIKLRHFRKKSNLSQTMLSFSTSLVHQLSKNWNLTPGSNKVIRLGIDYPNKTYCTLLNCPIHNEIDESLIHNELKLFQAFTGVDGFAQLLYAVSYQSKGKGKVKLVMPFYEKRDLCTYLETEPYISAAQLKSFVCQMAASVRLLHARGFIHKDIKPENFLIDRNLRLYLTDFGYCSTVDDTFFISAGSPAYAAPEARRAKPLSFGRDIWSLGVTFIALTHRNLQFAPKNIAEEGSEPLIYRAIQIPNPGNAFELALYPLIQRMLDFDPEKRPTIEQVCDYLNRNLASF